MRKLREFAVFLKASNRFIDDVKAANPTAAKRMALPKARRIHLGIKIADLRTIPAR